MPKYEKTAKDKAWEAKLTKVRAEASMWRDRYNVEYARCESYMRKNDELKQRIAELEAAITELTNGEATPEEILQKMRKQAELADTMKFLVNGARGMFY